MEDDFLIIAITSPSFIDNEAEKINDILSQDKAHLLHIRKPDSSFDQVRNLVSMIDPVFYPRIKLHDHFGLLNIYRLGGVHINSRNPVPHPEAVSVSKSFHSLKEIDDVSGLEYFFISPVFDSISKEGYKAAFNLEELAEKIKGKPAVALGGITPDKFPFLKSLGFRGAALLGHFFPPQISV